MNCPLLPAPLLALVATLGPIAASASQATPAPAQRPPVGAPVAANDDHVFVVHGGWLLQFDAKTLELAGSIALGEVVAEVGAARDERAGLAAAAAAAAAQAELETPQDPVVLEAPGDARPVLLNPAVVHLGIKWLVDHQDADGRWDADDFMRHDDAGEPCDGPGKPTYDVGVTGLCLLALLGDGSTMTKGPWRKHIDKAVAWLVDQQQQNGLIGNNTSHDFIYGHAIGALALIEAYARTEHEPLRKPAQLAIDYLESHRNPYSVWRYQPRDNDNDTSVTTWAVLACCAARDCGLEVNENAFKLADVFYKEVTEPSGRSGYSKAGEGSSRMPGDHMTRYPTELGEAMTAASMVGRLALGVAPDADVLDRGAAVLAAKPPAWTPAAGNIDPYYWHFGVRALTAIGGAAWQSWLRTLPSAVEEPQRDDGNFAGSWDPIGVWGEAGGRVCSTALYTLIAQAAIRRQAGAERKGR